MRRVLGYLLNIVLILVFAFISVYIPPNVYHFVMLAYFLVFLAINFVVIGISAKRLFKDLVYVSEGKIIFEESKKTIQLLQRKDRLLTQESRMELRTYAKNFLSMVLILIIVLSIVYSPQLREAVMSVPRTFFLTYFKDEKVSQFLSNAIFYLILMILFMSISRFSGASTMETTRIPSQYKVTKRGLIIDERLAYKFPLKVRQISQNKSRKYVELVISGIPGFKQGKVASKIRLYTNRVEELYKILKSNTEIE